MPSKTFFNLPEDKQERLLEAARLEFSRVSLNEASISNIVKHAEIPRGSFYQYFENKEDLFYYYFGKIKHNNLKTFEDALTLHQGDFFTGFEAYFEQTLYFLVDKKNRDFFKNMFLFMDYRSSRKMTPEVLKDEHKKKEKNRLKKECYQLIDQTTLNVTNNQELELLLQLMLTLMYQTIGDGFSGELSAEKMLQNFKLKLQWMRDGVLVKQCHIE